MTETPSHPATSQPASGHTVPAPAGEAGRPARSGPDDRAPGAAATGGARVDLAGLAAAVKSIERGENPAAPAPRGDAAEARRRRREAMAAEAAALQAAEAADGAGGAAADPAGAPPAAGTDTVTGGDGDHGDDSDDSDDSHGVSPTGTGQPAKPERPGDAAAAAAGAGTPGRAPAPGAEPAGDAAPDTAAPRARARRTANTERGAARRPAAVDPAAVAAAREVLQAGGAPAELAEEAVRGLGERAAQALREDPWGVLGLAGVRVEHADAFARALLGEECGPGDARRSRALVGHVLERAAEQGHTAVTSEALGAALARESVPDPESAMAAAVEDGRLLAFRLGSDAGEGSGGGSAEGSEDAQDTEDAEDDETEHGPLLLGLDRYALAEESLADGLIRLLRSFEGVSSEGVPSGGADRAAWEKAAAEAPSPSAAELIRAAADSGLVAHAGGEAARAEPAALVTAARAAGLRAYAAAYTENGRRRLADAVGQDAALTVGGLLDGAGPGRAEDGSLALDLLVVLDAPQLSVEEATDLVEAVPDGARLVLSGDPNALWSAGPGRVFADLLAAKVCPRIVSRTPDPGPIGELTSCVGIGELAAVDAPEREVVVVPVRDPREAVHRSVQLVADSVPRAIGVPAEQTQVITLAHGGPVGTRALNAALKERLNPGPGRFGGFDPGDRVVHVPAPGHTLPGTVVGAEADGLRLACEAGSVLVPREEVASSVRHGWAVTGHQAAGMRWPAVVVVVPGDAGPLLTRSWVYTAFARGERHLSVVRGSDQGLAQAVAGPAAKERTTRLVQVLREMAADS